MTNIKDVAKAAGVSPMTVSRAFNRPELVSPKTVDRVLAVAHELNYVPNLLARGLVTSETHTVGVFVSRPENALYSECLSGITKQAAAHGYNVLMACADSPDSAMTSIRVLMGRRIDGLILLGIDFRSGDGDDPGQTLIEEYDKFYRNFDSLAKECYEREFPVICISQAEKSSAPHCSGFVAHDYCEGAFTAVKYLVDRGHRRIGFLAHNVTDIGIWGERYRGFFRAVEKFGCETHPEWICRTTDTVDGGFSAMNALLDRSDLPTAVYCANDEIAVGAINACHARGVRVPQDISIMGHDGNAIGHASWPQLSTVSIHFREIGCRCVDLLLDQIAHKPFDRVGKLISSTLIERGSVADLRGK